VHGWPPVLGAGDRDVQAQPAHAHIAVLHTFDVG